MTNNMKYGLAIILSIFFISCGSFQQLSGPEKSWVIKHVFVAGKAKKISDEARALSNQMKRDSLLDGDGDGGRVDAFRHAYWMARLSQEFCWKKAISLGEAHERGNFLQYKNGLADEESVLPDSASGAMDLYNNRVGATIGCQNPGISNDSLKTKIYSFIKTGKLLIISKNVHGNPLDCAGNVIDSGLFKNKWNIPKCLVPSGF